MNVSSHHELGDSITFFDVKALGSQVNDDDADLPPIVWINCTGRIYKGNAMLYRQPAAWTNLGLIPFGKLYGNSGRYEGTLSWEENHVLLGLRIEIHAGGMPGHVARKRCVGGRSDPFDFDANGFH